MKYVFSIPEASCAHCKKAIELELNKMDGVVKPKVDLAAKTVSFTGEVDTDKVVTALNAIGYEASLISAE